MAGSGKNYNLSALRSGAELLAWPVCKPPFTRVARQGSWGLLPIPKLLQVGSDGAV